MGLCWVAFRGRNFADAKRKEVVCITLGFFFQILLVGMGFEHWEVGFRKKKMGWEMGLVPPLQDPHLIMLQPEYQRGGGGGGGI